MTALIFRVSLEVSDMLCESLQRFMKPTVLWQTPPELLVKRGLRVVSDIVMTYDAFHCNLPLAVKDKCKSLSKSLFFFFSFLSLTCDPVAFSSPLSFFFFKKQKQKNPHKAHLLLQWYSQSKSHPG